MRVATPAKNNPITPENMKIKIMRNSIIPRDIFPYLLPCLYTPRANSFPVNRVRGNAILEDINAARRSRINIGGG